MTVPPSPSGLFAGTSGWAYPTWKPGFYPANLPATKFLSHYSSRLNSVEVNYTFRALPTPAMLAGWLASAPSGFRFSFKAPQRITHFSRLRDSASQLAGFLDAVAPAAHAGKLGILLFQLPPNFKADPDRLRDFLATPALAANNGAQPWKLAFEFRHESWFSDTIYAILQQYQTALCIAEGDELATPAVHTADAFSAFRLRRSGGYTPEEVTAQAKKLTALSHSGREVYAYFRHEDEPTGALNAAAFLESAKAGPKVVSS
jgi:uncharacterized protein YecE (DUF72 family)